jgi:hypothetical protein
MKFAITESRKQLVLSVKDDKGKLGKGIVCHPDHLFTGDNLRNFLEFITEHKGDAPEEPIDILKELLPDQAKTIDRIVMEQAKAAVLGTPEPLTKGSESAEPFEDGDE